MRLLVDANLSPRVAVRLQDAGHETVHVRDVGLLDASDEKISAYALVKGYTIVSADSDFATMLALSGQTAPSLVLVRSLDRLSPDEQAELLVANIPTAEAELLLGAVMSLSQATFGCAACRCGRRRQPAALLDIELASWLASVAMRPGGTPRTALPGGFGRVGRRVHAAR